MNSYIIRQTRRAYYLYSYAADGSYDLTAYNNRAALLAAMGA